MTHEIIEPVLNNEGVPHWLIFKGNKQVAEPTKAKTAKGKIKEKQIINEVPDFELQKDSLYQCTKCANVVQANPEPPTFCSEELGGCNRTAPFKQLTKPINTDLWKLPIWQDIPVENLDMLGTYQDMLDLNKKLVVFAHEIEYQIFTLWIISTWKHGHWDTVGFPIFIGLPDSGKTRALRIIAELGYRCVNAIGVREKAIPRLTHYHDANLLIDEAHNKLNPKRNSDLLDFIKGSYKKGSTYVTCDNDDQTGLYVTRNFGFKAIAGEKSFNTALLSRGIVFWMEKDFPEIPKIHYVNDDLAKFRTILLNYRYKTDAPKDLGRDFEIKGRSREIFESIISTAKHIEFDTKEIIEYIKQRDAQEKEALKGTVEYDILKTLYDFEGNPTLFPEDSPNKIKVDTILSETGLNWLTGDKQTDNNARQRIGYILRNMGITTKREREGRVLFLQGEPNNSRLKRLYKRYGVGGVL